MALQTFVNMIIQLVILLFVIPAKLLFLCLIFRFIWFTAV